MNTLTALVSSSLPLRLVASGLLGLSLLLTVLRPDQPQLWLTSAISLLAGCIVWRYARSQSRAVAARLQHALTLAGSILCIALVAGLIDELRLLPSSSEDIGQRSQALIMAFVLLGYANLMPKMATSARWQAPLRFAGWTLVIAALIHAVSWLVAPIETARMIGIGAIAGALLLVSIRCLLAKRAAGTNVRS